MYDIDLENSNIIIRKLYKTKLGNRIINGVLNHLNQDKICNMIERYCVLINHHNSENKNDRELQEEITELNGLLQKINTKRFKKNEINSTLTSLYHLREMNLPLVDELLTKYDYETTVILNLADLKSKRENILNGTIKLSKQDYRFIVEMLVYDSISTNHLNIRDLLLDFCMKAAVEKQEQFVVLHSELEEIFKKMAKKISMEEIHADKLDVSFVNNDFMKECDGRYLDNLDMIEINRSTLDDPIKCLVAINHELIHQLQSIQLRKKHVVSTYSFIEIMDYINRIELGHVVGDKYYHDNYNWISGELEAHIFENKKTFAYLNSINAKIPEDFYKEAQERDSAYEQLFKNSKTHQYRYIGTELFIIDDIFSRNIYKHPEYLEMFPQLSMLYKEEKNCVVRKNLHDLEEDYSKYKDGRIFLNGNTEEISYIYEFQINNYKKQMSKDKPDVLENSMENQINEMIQAMEQGINIENTNQYDEYRIKQRGYSIIGILGLITCIATIGIILYGYILLYK